MSTVIFTPGTTNVSLLGNEPMLADAFGRLRVSNPLTLFDSSHRYKDNGLWATSTTGGRILAQGYVNSSNQGSPSINILKEALFSTQLERNSFTSTPFELVVEMAIDATGGTLGAYVSVDWEEVSR